MCIDRKWTKEQKDKWLKNKSDTITAYKVVFDGVDRFLPPFMGQISYQRKNRLGKRKTNVPVNEGHATYLPYYHLFATKYACKDFCIQGPKKVVKCKVPKKSITDMGRQMKRIVIITRAFDIVGEDEYFDKPKTRKDM